MRIWPKRLTDEQFVERVRVAQRRRKWTGVLLIVIGLMMMGMAAWMYGLLTRHLHAMDVEGAAPLSELARRWDTYFNFYTGVMAGVTIAANWVGGQLLATWGVIVIIGRWLHRRDALLLECWDQLHPAATSTADAS